uniref:GRAM domain-containing protein n=1 Tax=Acrobeloides nanus TaxID=290746 RepID=A0A914C3E0_9BILA
MQIFDLLKKNFDLVSMIADIDRPDAISLRAEGHSRQSTPSNIRRRQSRSVEPHTDINRKRSQSIAVPKLLLSGVELVNAPGYSNFDHIPQESPSWSSNLRKDLKSFYFDVMDAFSETNEDLKTKRPTSPTRLSATTLKRDIGRCLTESHSCFEALAGINDLFIWKNPIATLSIFAVYMYSVYKGWLASLVLGLVLLQLIFNFLATQKKIDLGLQFVPRKQLQVIKFELSGIQLVFDVARRVQLLLTILANLLEKIKNLFMWERPEVTFKFFLLVLAFFVNSVIFSNNAYFIGIGFLIGGRAFLTNYLYHRFPKMQKLFDVFVYFWDRVPSEMEKKKRLGSRIKKSGSTPMLRKESTSIDSMENINLLKKDHELNHAGNSTFYISSQELRRRSIGFIPMPKSRSSSPLPQKHRMLSPFSSTGSNFLDSKLDHGFYLDSDRSDRSDKSEEEASLGTSRSLTSDSSYDDNIHITRPCFFVDKEKVFSGGMAEGDIVLGDNKLTFHPKEAYRSFENVLNFPFNEISKIKKIKLARTFNFLPGKTKGIEVYLNYQIKPLQFVGIVKRDEFYEIALETARIAGFDIGHDEG